MKTHTGMKTLMVGWIMVCTTWAWGQSSPLVGTWQVTEEKTCFESEITGNESDTEKELLQEFGKNTTAVARLIRFKSNGTGEEGIFAAGQKKGESMRTFTYTLRDGQLLLMDKKSGIITQKLRVDELTSSTFRFHLEGKDCESKTLTRTK
ncbi:MAG: hypothetical protein JNL17_03755 [Cyclobacteriaceae bacterium]|nr:hypothetical protein [Cyclobacteriaceae bacterium]